MAMIRKCYRWLIAVLVLGACSSFQPVEKARSKSEQASQRIPAPSDVSAVAKVPADPPATPAIQAGDTEPVVSAAGAHAPADGGPKQHRTAPRERPASRSLEPPVGCPIEDPLCWVQGDRQGLRR